MKRVILGFFSCLVCVFVMFCAHGAGYVCNSIKYTECNAGYYMTYNGVADSIPKADNDCTACPSGAKYCPGGTFAPMYAVTLNANGGTAGNITTIYRTQGNGWYYNTTDTSIGTKITTLTSAQLPTRPGYTFNGFTTSTGTQIIKNDGTIASGYDSGMGTIIYAQWTLNTYTIKYNANGGTGTMSDTKCTYGSDCTLRTNTFTKTGYTFAGWTYNGTSYSNGQTVSNLTSTNGATLTFTAQWTANTYTIKYDANGGTGTMSDTTCTYGSNCTLRTNAFTKTGYTFAGWTYNGTSYSNGATVKNLSSTNGATLTFTAQWTANTYTIKYDANGGTGTMSDTTCTYGSDCALRTNAFTKTGYTFAGWTYNGTTYSNGATVKNLSSTNGATLTFTAQWTANTYAVTLNGNGANYGNTTCTNHNIDADVYYTYDTNVFHCYTNDTKNAIEPHILTGYELNGYYTSASGGTKVINADGTLVAKNLITSNTTLYAQWTANTYTIKYDSNGGTGTMSNTTCTYGSNCTLRTNAFTKTGYTFAGWTYNGTSYSNGQTVSNLTSTNGATLTFTAQWTANTYTLTLDRNGATSGDTTATIQYGANGFCSAGSKTDTTCSLNIYTPYRTGYTFNGYFTEQTGGTMWIDNNGYPVSSTIITSSRTLYAQYTANKYNCPAGEYLSGTSCVTCPAGSYCPGVTDQEYTGGDIGVITCPENSSTRGLTGQAYCTCDDGYNNNGETTTMYSACVANTYTIKYDANGGSGTMQDTVCTYYSDCALRTNSFTKTGYGFVGWLYDGVTYQDANTVRNLTVTNGATITFVAQWAVNSISCSPGEYLDDATCRQCESDSYCTGGTWEYDGGVHGITKCPGVTDKLGAFDVMFVNTAAQTSVEQCRASFMFAEKWQLSELLGVTDIVPDVNYDEKLNKRGFFFVNCDYDLKSGKYDANCTGVAVLCGAGYVSQFTDSPLENGNFRDFLYHATSPQDAIENTCMSVGDGYWSPGADSCAGMPFDSEKIQCMNRALIGRNKCPNNLRTIGYGLGADEAGDCGRILHVDNGKVYLRSEKRTTPSLNVRVDGVVYYGDMAEYDVKMNIDSDRRLRVRYNDTLYWVHDDSVL